MNLRRFVETVGDLPVKSISRHHVAKFVETLSALPVALSLKPATLRTAPVSVLLQYAKDHPDCPRLSPHTVNIHRASVSYFLTWCIRQDYIQTNPTQYVDGAPLPEIEKHQPSMPWQEVPAFYKRLQAIDKPAARIVCLVILTGARIEMVLGMKWEEINLGTKLWSLSATRMKVPNGFKSTLPSVAVALMGEPGTGLVFPSTRTGKQVSGATISRLLDSMGTLATAHGYRATLVEWADVHDIDESAVEVQLAHGQPRGNKTARAYRRGDIIDRRRVLLDRWADYVTSG
jgi:integrase